MREERDRARSLVEAARSTEHTDPGTALHLLEGAVALDPSRASWQYRLGLLRDRLGDWSGAVDAFEAAAREAPDRPAYVYRLGLARQRCWDLAGAAVAYAEAALLAPHRQQWVRRSAQVRQLADAFIPFTGTVVAHRGAAAGLPENTVESLASLPRLVGGVEIDVRLSRDGVPVLMHDQFVNRTTDGSGKVEDLAYGDLASLTLADGARVPTLRAYLDECRKWAIKLILVDVKEPSPITLRTVASVVGSSPVTDSCVVMLRTGQQLAMLREVTCDLRLGCFGVRKTSAAERIANARAYGAELLLVAHGDTRYLDNRRVVPQVRAAGLRAGASTINTRRALEAARRDRCDVLMTDRSDQLRHFVRAGDGR